MIYLLFADVWQAAGFLEAIVEPYTSQIASVSEHVSCGNQINKTNL